MTASFILHLNLGIDLRKSGWISAAWTKQQPAFPHSHRRATRMCGARVFLQCLAMANVCLESQGRRKRTYIQPRCSLYGSLTTCLLLNEMPLKLSKWRMLWTHCTTQLHAAKINLKHYIGNSAAIILAHNFWK